MYYYYLLSFIIIIIYYYLLLFIISYDSFTSHNSSDLLESLLPSAPTNQKLINARECGTQTYMLLRRNTFNTLISAHFYFKNSRFTLLTFIK